MPRRKKRRGRPSAIARTSTADLMKEMERRRGSLGSMYATRDDLTRQLESLNAEISEIESLDGGTAPARRGPGRPKGSGKGSGRGARGRGRGGNEQSLPMRLHSLLRGKTMSVPEMAQAAKKAGHKTKAKNFALVVRLALLNNRKMFKRVSRGQYTAK